jgi:hypothetical protein
MFAEMYEKKARECSRLIRSCSDPATSEMLKGLADQYLAKAGELRRNRQSSAAPASTRAPESRWRAALAAVAWRWSGAALRRH